MIKKNFLLSNIAIFLIRCYQLWLSPSLTCSCRFYPTCSQYGIEVIKKYGFWIGIIKTLRRILRCRPFGGSGYDPV